MSSAEAAGSLSIRRAQRSAYLPRCREGAVVQVNDDTSTVRVVPMTCKSWRCPHCGPRQRRAWAWKIARAHPQKFLTFTADPARFTGPLEAYEKMKAAIPPLVRAIRKRWGPFEYVGVWELQPCGMPHIHIGCRSEFIPIKWLQATWSRLGIGSYVWINAVRSESKCAYYVSKELTKSMDVLGDTVEFKRLIFHSRGFFPKDDEDANQDTHLDDIVIYTMRPINGLLEDLVHHLGAQILVEPKQTLIVLEIPRVGPRGPPLHTLVDGLCRDHPVFPSAVSKAEAKRLRLKDALKTAALPF